MKSYWYKDYFIILERNPINGSIEASGDIPRRVFYGYTLKQIKAEIKATINGEE